MSCLNSSGFVSVTCFVHLIIFLGSFPSSLRVLKRDPSVRDLALRVGRDSVKKKAG